MSGSRLGRVASWWSVAVLALLGTSGSGSATDVALVAAVPGEASAGDRGHPGLVVAAVLAALALVALWRVLLRLVVVVLVALGLIGLAVVLAPGVARADTGAPVAAVAGPGALPVLALVVLVAAVFLVGLLMGEQWHRRQVARRDRQLADARRELDALTRVRRGPRGPA